MAKTRPDQPKKPTTYDLAEELGIPVLTPMQWLMHAHNCAVTNTTLGTFGRPGVGKTELMHQLCEQLTYQCISERLNGRDPTDVGFPYTYTDSVEIRRHGYTVPEWFLSAFEELPEGFKGRAVFFD